MSLGVGARLALAAVLLVGACGDDDGPEGPARDSVEPLLVGLLFQSNELELPALQGAQLAIEQVNAGGGVEVDGARRQLRTAVDDAGETPELALEAARRLINQRGIAALIGPNFSFQAIPVAEAAEAAQLPMVTPGSTNPATTEGKRYVFRGSFIDPFQGGVMASYASSELGATTAAVLNEASNEYSAGLAAEFAEAFRALDGDVVATETYTGDNLEFTAQLGRIRDLQPDVLYLPNFTVVPDQLREARELGITARFLGSDSWGNDGLGFDSEQARHDYFEGAVWTTHWSPDVDTERSRRFVRDYRARYDADPTDASALTYDAVLLLVDALERAGSSDHVALRDGLAAIEDFAGVTGTISYGDDGDPAKPALVRTYTNGAVATVGFFS